MSEFVLELQVPLPSRTVHTRKPEALHAPSAMGERAVGSLLPLAQNEKTSYYHQSVNVVESDMPPLLPLFGRCRCAHHDMSSPIMEVLRSEINAIGRRRALQKLVLEAPLMIESREASHRAIPRANCGATAMNVESLKKDDAGLYWLAFLLTGRRDISIGIAVDTAVSQYEANPFFAGWMGAWSRRIIIARALAAIRDELAESARRTGLARVHQSAAPARKWLLSPDTTKVQIEEALLAIDVFPRAAVLLPIFEGVRIADTATLLNVDATLVRKGQAVGLRELATHLARKKDHAFYEWSPTLALA